MLAAEKFDKADSDFAMVAELSRGRHGLRGIRQSAQEMQTLAKARSDARTKADQFLDRVAPCASA